MGDMWLRRSYVIHKRVSISLYNWTRGRDWITDYIGGKTSNQSELDLQRMGFEALNQSFRNRMKTFSRDPVIVNDDD